MKKLAKNPAAAYAQGKDAGHTFGVFDGFYAFSAAALLAADNVWTGSDEELKAFFTAWEREVNRIFVEDCRKDPEYVQEAIGYHTDKLRERMGLDERTD